MNDENGFEDCSQIPQFYCRHFGVKMGGQEYTKVLKCLQTNHVFLFICGWKKTVWMYDIKIILSSKSF